MNGRKTAVAVFCEVLLGSLYSNAATVFNHGGAVLVSKGDSFLPIKFRTRTGNVSAGAKIPQ